MRKCPFCEKTRDEGAFIFESKKTKKTAKLRRCRDCRMDFIKRNGIPSLKPIDDYDDDYDDDFDDDFKKSVSVYYYEID